MPSASRFSAPYVHRLGALTRSLRLATKSAPLTKLINVPRHFKTGYQLVQTLTPTIVPATSLCQGWKKPRFLEKVLVFLGF